MNELTTQVITISLTEFEKLKVRSNLYKQYLETVEMIGKSLAENPRYDAVMEIENIIKFRHPADYDEIEDYRRYLDQKAKEAIGESVE